MVHKIVNQTESKVTWEMGLWACLWDITSIALRWVDTPVMDGTICFLRSWTVWVDKGS